MLRITSRCLHQTLSHSRQLAVCECSPLLRRRLAERFTATQSRSISSSPAPKITRANLSHFSPYFSITTPPRYTLLPNVLHLRPRSAAYHSYGSGAGNTSCMPLLWALIIANAGIWVGWYLALPSSYSKTGNTRLRYFLEKHFLESLESWRSGRWWTPFTSAASHMGIGHLVFNMMGLYVFGRALDLVRIGPVNLSLLLLGSAASGSAAWLYRESLKPAREGRRSVGLGASGAVMGLGAAAALVVPRLKLAVYGVVPVPLYVFVPLYVLVDLYYLNQEESRVAHAGHLGGAAFGAAFATLFLRRYMLWHVRF